MQIILCKLPSYNLNRIYHKSLNPLKIGSSCNSSVLTSKSNILICLNPLKIGSSCNANCFEEALELAESQSP